MRIEAIRQNRVAWPLPAVYTYRVPTPNFPTPHPVIS
jgi:hypothetical protein